MYRTCHGTWHDCWPLTRSNTTREREREVSKPEGNTMNTTVAATDSCWMACQSLRSMVCSITVHVSIWIAHCTSTYQASRRGCARQLFHVPPGHAPRAPRTGTGQATHLPLNHRVLSISASTRTSSKGKVPMRKGKPHLAEFVYMSRPIKIMHPLCGSQGSWIRDACAR